MQLCTLILLSLCTIDTITAQGYGALRFYRQGSTSHLYTSGILQVFYHDFWGNVCYNDKWGTDEADVVCRQLGWSGAASTSLASIGTVTSYGLDPLYSIITSVDCPNNTIPVMLQCSIDTVPSSSMCGNDDNDVTVTCYTSRVWESLGYPGMLRLVGGRYITEGRVEVYCNDQWGTVCDDKVSNVEADTICRHLGYSEAVRYDHLILPGNSTQPIWLDEVHCGISSRGCVTECRKCPLLRSDGRPHHDCVHGEDLTIACTYLDNVGGSSYETCSMNYTTMSTSAPVGDDSSNNTLIIGVLVGIAVLAIFIFSIVGFVCGILFCGRNHGKGTEDEGNEGDDKRSATPTLGSLSPEVIQMESSPKMYHKEFEPHFVPQDDIKTGNYYHHQPAAYNPAYGSGFRGNDDRTFSTTPPAYMGQPATNRFY